jgi:hypothetical protein
MSISLFIVNDFDRPDHKHLTIRKEDGLLYYVHPEMEKWKGMSVDRATPLEDFGVTCHVELGILHGILTDESSRATYRDGRPRRWQGPERFSFVMNKHFQDYKAEALRAGGVI